MPQQSKYSDKVFEELMHDLIVTLERNKASTDLSLMVMGNIISSILNNDISPENRKDVVDKFCDILKKSTLDNN